MACVCVCVCWTKVLSRPPKRDKSRALYLNAIIVCINYMSDLEDKWRVTAYRKHAHLTWEGRLFATMGSTTGGAHLLLVINDVQPFKDNSITSPAMCNQSLSRKWICTRVTKSVAKALSIQADLKIYATLLVAGTRFSVWITAKSFTSNLKCKQPNWMDVNYGPR